LSNPKEWHNDNRIKQYCTEEEVSLAMTTAKTIKRPIRIQNSPETTQKRSQTTHRHTETFKRNNKPSNAAERFKISVDLVFYYLLEMHL